MLFGEARKPEQCKPGLLRGGSRNPSSKVVFVAVRLSETNKCHLFISDSRVALWPIIPPQTFYDPVRITKEEDVIIVGW